MTKNRTDIRSSGTMGAVGCTADSLDDFGGSCFDTALSSSPAALPTLPSRSRVTRSSVDWPFAPLPTSRLFADRLKNYPLDSSVRAAIDREYALRSFPRLAQHRHPLAETAARSRKPRRTRSVRSLGARTLGGRRLLQRNLFQRPTNTYERHPIRSIPPHSG
ncbi:hypothetical protein [Mycobacterium sp. GA-2829]|uniref:hypothetical protein n=1 Tax=Mycobacterium sp. GA-2829 TaxID=1772283 RepID=UPI0012F95792|nr:hypothetical protein [Mycobacterium sp. GA-2829]